MEAHKILIVSYTFPPTGGIGGRRWAKFAKYLYRSGADIQVLAAKHTHGPVSDWHQDIAELAADGRVHYFDSGYPAYLGIQPATLFEKLAYRASLFYVRQKLKGNYYDRSAHCRDILLEQAESFIEKGYNNIIVTVGPFIYSWYLSELKLKYPWINMILDVRDPWTNNKTSFGYDSLSPQRFAYEQNAEKETATRYDHITAVADDINAYFSAQYKIPESRLHTIKNGYDTDDFPVAERVCDGGGLKLVFTGTVYNKALKYVDMLSQGLQQLKTSHPQVYNDISCSFYGIVPAGFAAISARESKIQYLGNIPLQEVYGVIDGACAAMLFLTDDLAYSFSTKFYEYLSQKKPVIVFSKGGKTGDFVEQNDIGLSVTADNMSEKLLLLHDLYKTGKLYINPAFDISEFSVENLAQKFIPLLKQATATKTI